MDKLIYNGSATGSFSGGPAHPQSLPKEPPPLFTDDSGGFQFNTHNWNVILRNGERERFYDDAAAHRDEALSRTVQCRLLGRRKEAEHWHAAMRFLENSFKIPPAGEDHDGSST